MQKKCKICIKNFEIIVDLNNSETAKKIWDSLPINSKINVWGEEVYFYVSASAELESDAKEVINFGEIVYWSAGKAIAIGFGKTPISVGDEIRLADKCNVWGKTKFDLKKLKNINSGCEVLVEKY
ncbi:MAG: hypothetical protein CL572_00710 [Alphaproteobacteria bacterium]|jgi:hypothetical protein|nr:hypothetical protein [Alphaproteobacteria bacterium]|tara:strand:+ start:169 stop:543 length:375 start_codon:yes stop_codon:yes gene_type:complete